ncbi:hypothetical protein chiPu_0026106 [Chiloscyllium punctatum]|uniref:Uncharacterized protein n=1 Tax=Chiloscyllium punctatum TaxID=137246 RepID=A0A401THC6_CHIPU|nr:hypothetical protein [Chiloscyllium punctatum]
MNRTLKVAIVKAMAETGQGWVGVLPCILTHLRATPGHSTGLTPFELMTGRAMRLPETVIEGERDPRPTCLRRAEAMDLGGVHVRNDVRYARRPHFGPGFQRIRDVGPVRLRLL